MFAAIGCFLTMLIPVSAPKLALTMHAPVEAFELTTTYIRICGAGILPEPDPVFSPVLYREYKDKLSYTKFSPELFDDEDLTKTYLRSVIRQLKLKI
ncbi:MAG: hypothetical protein K6A76_08910 [Oribacterium sp.]|nr:hypothetical protein [Oribacterium sp.]